MTVAAAYARFSSDAQREESIEIQLDEISRFVERHGWTLGETYADRAVSGRREDRPAFNRCVADAMAGRFDVLVVYKMDRFARNVAYAQEVKRRLFAAGIGLWSVREGQMSDTPEGFLWGGMSDLWAEYYSRNLSVMVRNGIREKAEGLKAAGRRIYGYDVDGEDRFVVNEAQAEYVRAMFSRYLAGQTMNQIAEWLNERGARTIRGNAWSTPALAQVMRNVAYKGVYRYAGHEVVGGMPRIVSDEDFDRVQGLRSHRKNSKRRRVVNDYLLTDKVFCLRCGRAMCGTAGTSCTGRKYTYYGCVNKGGCGLRVSSAAVEHTVSLVVARLLNDPGTLRAIAEDMVEYGRSLPSHAEEHEAERAEVRRRLDNYVRALGEGAPYQSLSGAMSECEARLAELDALIEEDGEASAYLSVEAAEEFLSGAMGRASVSDEWSRALVEAFVDRIYVDKERVVVAFALTDEPGGEPFEYSVDEVRSVAEGRADARPIRSWPLVSPDGTKKCEPADESRVRTDDAWWASVTLLRTERKARRGTSYLVVSPLMTEG